MSPAKKIRVAVNGYGVIGKRVADAVALQDDMELAGVADISADWRPRMAMQKGLPPFRGHRGTCGGDAERRSRCRREPR